MALLLAAMQTGEFLELVSFHYVTAQTVDIMKLSISQIMNTRKQAYIGYVGFVEAALNLTVTVAVLRICISNYHYYYGILMLYLFMTEVGTARSAAKPPY